MKCRALRAHEIRHHHIQDGRRRAADDRPFHIGCRGVHCSRIRPQKVEHRRPEEQADHGNEQPPGQCAVKSEGRAFSHGIKILPPQSPAHHTGASHAEQVADRVKGQHDRRCQRHGRILQRIVQPPHKIRVCQAVNDHHQRTEDRRDHQLFRRLWNRHLFKNRLVFDLVHRFVHLLSFI